MPYPVLQIHPCVTLSHVRLLFWSQHQNINIIVHFLGLKQPGKQFRGRTAEKIITLLHIIYSYLLSSLWRMSFYLILQKSYFPSFKFHLSKCHGTTDLLACISCFRCCSYHVCSFCCMHSSAASAILFPHREHSDFMLSNVI